MTYTLSIAISSIHYGRSPFTIHILRFHSTNIVRRTTCRVRIRILPLLPGGWEFWNYYLRYHCCDTVTVSAEFYLRCIGLHLYCSVTVIEAVGRGVVIVLSLLIFIVVVVRCSFILHSDLFVTYVGLFLRIRCCCCYMHVAFTVRCVTFSNLR